MCVFRFASRYICKTKHWGRKESMRRSETRISKMGSKEKDKRIKREHGNLEASYYFELV